MKLTQYLATLSFLLLTGCMDDSGSKNERPVDPAPEAPAADVTTPTPNSNTPSPARVARPIFIQPYESCKLVADEATGTSRTVCAQVAISGATEPGEKFSDIASCQDVRTQRFFAPLPADNEIKAGDPRLADEAFMKELAWVNQEIRATGCACCHDTKSARGFAKWDISAPNIWTQQLSDRGAAILAGDVDSATLGAFPADQNHGFDRSQTGAPTTDIARMKAFFKAELERRKVSAQQISEMEPLGGRNFVARVTLAPTACEAGSGIDQSGKISWTGEAARYIYLLKPGSKAPVFPPNLDLPEGTLWRLDVAASAAPLDSGLSYGSIPAGSKQRFPAEGAAPKLVKGESYWLYVLKDVGFPVSSCIFTY